MTTKSERRITIHPDDWWNAWETEAQSKGMNLSEWMGQACNKALPKSVQQSLSERKLRGRPRKIDSQPDA